MKKSLLLIVLFISSAAMAKDVALPAVPDSLRIPEQRADFVAIHFWDSAATDTPGGLADYSPREIEQAFVDFLSVFPIASDNGRRRAVASLIDLASCKPEVFNRISALAEKYLYNTDSPLASDDYYLLFLDEIIANPNLSANERLRPAWQRECILKNRPGDTVPDFEFDSRSGERLSLYSVLENLEPHTQLLLIFYDPDCDHCSQVLSRLSAPDAMAPANSLKILAIYSGDDRALWEQTSSNLPADWAVGYEDGTLQDENLFALRTMPTLYLLGADKRVVEKELKADKLREVLPTSRGASTSGVTSPEASAE